MTPQKKTDLVDKLKKLMIRHTKAQRIGGVQALALPTLDSETEWLVFAPNERGKYNAGRQSSLEDSTVQKARSSGMGVVPLTMRLHQMTVSMRVQYSLVVMPCILL